MICLLATKEIYTTDSFANLVYKISSNGKATVFSKSEKFETKGIGLNGIVYHPGGFLLVDNSNTGQIFKVEIQIQIKLKKSLFISTFWVQTEYYWVAAINSRWW